MAKFETNFITKVTKELPFFKPEDENITEETKEIENPARKFFTKWCEINDSIVPEFISREDWEKKKNVSILEKKENSDIQTLFIPEDLHLWEIINIVRAVDADTFANKQELQNKRTDKIMELATTFQQAGAYLNSYLPEVKKNQGRDIVEEISDQFYEYGLFLENRNNSQITKDISKIQLTLEDKQKLDKWFLGEQVYQKRRQKLDDNLNQQELEAVIEEQRKNILKIYFRALSKEGYKEKGEEPWQSKKGPIQQLQEKTIEQITKSIKIPETEMIASVFNRGVEFLKTSMGFNQILKILEELEEKQKQDKKKMTAIDRINLRRLKQFKETVEYWQNLNYKTIYESLGITNLKQELDETSNISKKEREIALKIQGAINNFPYKEHAINTSEIIKTEFVNCYSANILGGAFLDELGIKYLNVRMFGHALTFLITSDAKIYWQDFTPPSSKKKYNHEITEESIVTKNITLQDIRKLLNQPEGAVMSLDIKVPNVQEPVHVTLCNSKIIFQFGVLNHIGNELYYLNRYEEAIKAYQKAIELDPEYFYPYCGLGNALYGLEKYEEAVESYKKAIELDPEISRSYSYLGNTLYCLKKYEEAIKVYQKVIELDPETSLNYNYLGNTFHCLKKYEEAVEAYKKAIELDPEDCCPYNGLGHTLLCLERYKEAIEAYKEFLRLAKNNFPDAVSNVKKILQALEAK